MYSYTNIGHYVTLLYSNKYYVIHYSDLTKKYNIIYRHLVLNCLVL